MLHAFQRCQYSKFVNKTQLSIIQRPILINTLLFVLQVRALVGDRMALVIQAVSAVLIAWTMGLVIAWRLALVIIAVQPLIICCFYARNVLLRSVSNKSVQAPRNPRVVNYPSRLSPISILSLHSHRKAVFYAFLTKHNIWLRRKTFDNHGLQDCPSASRWALWHAHGP